MLRVSLCSAAVLALVAVGFVKADATKKQNDKEKATITKMDATNGTITVTMKDKSGKSSEKTLHLASGVEYLDASGKTAKMSAFHPGQRVLITEKDGKVSELEKRKEAAKATITKVDAKNGTVTVMMKDKNGKVVPKTFQLSEDAEYMDSTGRVASVDVFRSGDEVLVVEGQGKIQEMKKKPTGQTSHGKTPGGK